MGTDGTQRGAAKNPESLGMLSRRSPLAMEGASNRGGWGNWGSDPAHSESVSAVAGGWHDGCRRAWRAHCPAERESGNSSERDRPAVFLGHKALLCFVNRAAGWEGGAGGRRRGPGTGGPAKRVPVLGRHDT
jgi:hypothetical protein